MNFNVTEKNLLEFIQTDFNLFDFLDNLDMGAYVVDPHRKILFWNQKARNITGFNPDEVVGTACHDRVLNHRDRMGIDVCNSELCPLVRSMKNQKSFHIPYSLYAKGRNGHSLPLKIMTFPLIRDGNVVGGVELFDLAEPESNDMMMATNIQHALVPRDLPEKVNVFYYPSSFIGGDLVFVNQHWSALVDVSGHGVSSALISAGLRVLLGEILTAGLDIRDVGNLMEDRFRQFGETSMHCTAIFAKRCPGGLQVVSYGHPEPIKISQDGIEPVEIEYDVLIGWGKPHTRSFKFVPMEEGESLLFYSDGITEIKQEAGPLDTEGLVTILNRTNRLEEIYIHAMSASVEENHADDISMIMIHA